MDFLAMKTPWQSGGGAEADIVLATRVRLARNIKDRLMPQKLDAEQGGQVLNQCKGILGKCSKPKFDFFKMDELSPIERGVLIEKHFVSPAFAQPSPFAAAAVSEDRELCVMINEEDHIRIQCILPGLQLLAAWEKASATDDMLAHDIEFAFDSQFGYLTACPTNLGTGLRASVMVHLPALSLLNRTQSCFNNLSRMGMTVRGMYGEGSGSMGNLFQISNQLTLGLSEAEILENMHNVILQIVEAEREARKTLRQRNEPELCDNIWRAYAMLAHSRKMSIEEMMGKLSYLRLGVDMGIIEGIDRSLLTDIMISCQTACIQYSSQGASDQAQIEQQRATLLRASLPLLR